MRIIKLSKKEFEKRSDVANFFNTDLKARNPPGKFNVTKRAIAKGGLIAGEPLLFTYKVRVVFTALAESSLLPNDNENREAYPNYFIVNLATLIEADVSLYEVERWFEDAGFEAKSLIGQGWNSLPDTEQTDYVWNRLRGDAGITLAEEIADPAELMEGTTRTIKINAYERNPEARRRCIEYHGTTCCICQFDFGTAYGEVAEGFIHVHHLRSLSEIGREYVVDPIEDLRPVCPNCHAVLHRKCPPYSIAEVQTFLRKTSGP